MPQNLRIGLIGLDTSHAPAFTQRLNKPDHPEHVPGGQVTIAWPGGSPDLEISRSRIDGFTKQLRDEFGVQLADSPEAVAEAVDLLCITSVDGRLHRQQLERTLKYRRPTFVDKPFTLSSDDAREMFRMAKEAGVPLMSSSALRYSDNLQAALADESAGAIVGCDVFGPMAEQPSQPGLFWYGVHTVEVAVAVMGIGCREVRAVRNDDFDLVSGIWSDGRMCSIRGSRRGHKQFGATIHREKGFQLVDLSQNPRSYYCGMLEAIVRSLPAGKPDVPADQTIEIVRLIEAANEGRQGGRPVELKK